MYRMGYIYLATRFTVFVSVLVLLFIGAYKVFLTVASIVIGSIILYKTRGGITMSSYIVGLLFLSAVYVLASTLYRANIESIKVYFAYYASLIPLLGSLTTSEILALSKHKRMRPILYFLIIIKIYSQILERFRRSLEIYRVFHNRGFKAYFHALRSLLGSMPLLVLYVSEYLYVNLRFISSQPSDQH